MTNCSTHWSRCRKSARGYCRCWSTREVVQQLKSHTFPADQTAPIRAKTSMRVTKTAQAMKKRNIAIINFIVQDLWYHNPAPNPKPSLMQCNSGLDVLKLHVQEPPLLHALRNMQWIEASSKQSWYISRPICSFAN